MMNGIGMKDKPKIMRADCQNPCVFPYTVDQ